MPFLSSLMAFLENIITYVDNVEFGFQNITRKCKKSNILETHVPLVSTMIIKHAISTPTESVFLSCIVVAY